MNLPFTTEQQIIREARIAFPDLGEIAALAGAGIWALMWLFWWSAMP